MVYKPGFFGMGLAAYLSIMPTHAQAKEPGQNHAGDTVHWKTRPFIYEIGGKQTTMTLMGKKVPKRVTFEEALELVRDDKRPYALLVGDYSPGELETIKNTLSRFYRFNPNLVSHLELVFIKYEKDSPGSLPNRAGDAQNLEKEISRWEGFKKRNADGVSIAQNTQADILDAWYGHLLAIPVSPEQYKIVVDRISAYYHKKRTGNKFDIFLSGDTSVLSDSLPHELIHLLIDESSQGIELLRDLTRCRDSNLLMGRENMPGIQNSEAEVLNWIANKESNLKMLIKLAEENSRKPEGERQAPPKGYGITRRGVEDDYKRIEKAVKQMGPSQTHEFMRGVFQEVAMPLLIAEEAAVTGDEVVMGRQQYIQSQISLDGGARLRDELRKSLELLKANGVGLEGPLLKKGMRRLQRGMDETNIGLGHKITNDYLKSFRAEEPTQKDSDWKKYNRHPRRAHQGR